MRAIELITDIIPPLVHNDTGEKALIWMEEFKVSHLPVLKNGEFVGLLSESDVLDKLNDKDTLDSLFDHLPRLYVLSDFHIYEVLSRMSDAQATVMPILDKNEKYLGCVSNHEILKKLAATSSIKEQGGILVIECNKKDYSMSQIAQIVESDNAKILSSYIFSKIESTEIEITLKINQLDLTRIMRSFQRYDYTIKASYQTKLNDNDVQWRYDVLMNYLKF